MEKKNRVAILCVGKNNTNDTTAIDYLQKYFLNDVFHCRYEYDIFFATDDCGHIKKEYFGNNLKGVSITETDWSNYSNVLPFEDYLQKYLNLNVQAYGYMDHRHTLYQFYRMYVGYNLIKKYQEENNVKYDYFVKIRPDCCIIQDVNILFDILETTNKKIIVETDTLFIIKSEFEDIFKCIEHYSLFTQSVFEKSYMHRHLVPENPTLDNERVHRFSPENIFLQYINYVVSNKSLKIENVFIGLQYSTFNVIYLGEGKYKYVNDIKPVQSIDELKKYWNF
jgi:hypothetical protein